MAQRSERAGVHRPPSDCPVCGDRLLVTRLSCDGCETELTGRFPASAFSRLNGAELDVLVAFLRSRGNMKDLERQLGVSYPTARARFDAVLARLGLVPTGAESPTPPVPPTPPEPPDRAGRRADLLAAVARGEVDIDDAMARLAGGLS